MDPAVAALAEPESNLGLRVGRVRVVDHDPGWTRLFRDLKEAIDRACLGLDAHVAHIGSTSVSDLAAKPLLDVAVGLSTGYDVEDVIERIESLGYRFIEDLGDFGGLFFTVETGERFVVSHLHVVPLGGFQWRWYLTFRDALRNDDQLRQAYEALKREAARNHPEDRGTYTKAKSNWVLSTVQALDASDQR